MKRPIAVALFVFCGLALSAQEPMRFGERMEVEVVDLEVIVLDRNGEPITDLERKDFRILINRAPAEIVDFSANFTAAVPPTVSVQPAPSTVVAAAPEETDVWLVFVDGLRSGEFRRRVGIREVRDFMQTALKSGDRAMAAFFDGFALRVLQPLTDNPTAVSKAFRDLDSKAMPSRLQLLSFQMEEDDLFRAEMAAMRALRDFVGLASGVRGRRRMLLVGGGYRLYGWENPDFSARVQREYEQLRDTLASSGITVYGVWSWQEPEDWGGMEVGGMPPIDGPPLEFTPIGMGSTVATLANDTGGAPLTASSGLDGLLERAEQRRSGFYDLAVRTPGTVRGRRLNIKVEVAREGARVQHRRLVRLATDADTARHNSMASLLVDKPENPWNIDVRTGRVNRDALRRLRAPMQIRVPVDKVLVIDGGIHLQFFVSVRDARGNYTAADPRELKVSVSDAELAALRKNGIRYSLELIVSPGTTDVAVTVADVNARTHSAARTQVISR